MQAVPAQLVLADNINTITIRPAVVGAGDPVVCRQWDLGAPDVRAATADRPGADGTLDVASYTGARTVTLDLQLFGDATHSPYWFAVQLAAMTHPSRRAPHTISRATPENAGESWTLRLRGSPFSISYGRRAAAMLEMQLIFVAPLGLMEGPLRSYDSSEAGGVEQGLSFPISFATDFGYGNAVNPTVNVVVGGSAPIAPTIYIFGPATDPTVHTDDNEWFSFTGLTLTSGQLVAIDMDAGTVLLNGSPDASLYHLVDWSESTFWQWTPGAHAVHYVATTGRITAQWRERRLTI